MKKLWTNMWIRNKEIVRWTEIENNITELKFENIYWKNQKNIDVYIRFNEIRANFINKICNKYCL